MIFLSCYKLLSNSCDARCQGCSDCPFAEAYHNDKLQSSVKRLDIIKYAIVSFWRSWQWHRLMKKHSPELEKLLTKIIK
jgi:hypothetical protein